MNNSIVFALEHRDLDLFSIEIRKIQRQQNLELLEEILNKIDEKINNSPSDSWFFYREIVLKAIFKTAKTTDSLLFYAIGALSRVLDEQDIAYIAKLCSGDKHFAKEMFDFKYDCTWDRDGEHIAEVYCKYSVNERRIISVLLPLHSDFADFEMRINDLIRDIAKGTDGDELAIYHLILNEFRPDKNNAISESWDEKHDEWWNGE